MTYRPGAIVQLKSGGPAMTVEGAEKDGLRCIWHAAGDGPIQTALIPAICLDELVLDDEEDDEDM